jgi:uncharacterized protein with GYD domain
VRPASAVAGKPGESEDELHWSPSVVDGVLKTRPGAEFFAVLRESGHDGAVPVYITLMKFTSAGMGGIPAWRDRVEEAERAIEMRGGRLLDAYVTLGRFDVVEIFEAPDDETAYQVLIEVAKHGQVTTETLRAFTREEAEQIVKAS